MNAKIRPSNVGNSALAAVPGRLRSAVGIILRSASGALLAAFAALATTTVPANAATVNYAYAKNDPRYMTTGCKFEQAFSSGGSIGIWVKGIETFADGGASLFGSCHINANTSNDQGVLLFLDETGTFGFIVAGSKNGAGHCRRQATFLH